MVKWYKFRFFVVKFRYKNKYNNKANKIVLFCLLFGGDILP